MGLHFVKHLENSIQQIVKQVTYFNKGMCVLLLIWDEFG